MADRLTDGQTDGETSHGIIHRARVMHFRDVYRVTADSASQRPRLGED